MQVPKGAPCADDRSKWCLGAPSEWMLRTPSINGTVVPLANQIDHFRYLLSVDGVGCADRFPQLLASSSAALKQVSPYREFWYSDIVEGKHFFPVDSDFSNLTATVAAAEVDGGKTARKVVLAANDYVQKYLSDDARVCYLHTVLTTYADRLHNGGATTGCSPPADAIPYDLWFNLTRTRLVSIANGITPAAAATEYRRAVRLAAQSLHD